MKLADSISEVASADCVRVSDSMAFKGFISYSHGVDGKLAPAVQHALHRIAKPWYRLRSMRIFRDQTNLGASPGLWSFDTHGR
jgi:hypothetical protein